VPGSTVTEADPKSAPDGASPKGPAPIGDSAPPVDEFAHIPARRRRPPVLALAAAGLALFLAIRMRHDVGYALSSSKPLVIDARTLAAAPLEQLPVNRFLRIAGLPDRESAVILDTQGSWTFRQMFRLRGTNGRVFVRRVEDPLPVALAGKDEFEGRLVRFRDLSFAGSISRHFESQVAATHFFRPATLRAAIEGSRDPVVVADLSGARVTLAPTDRLTLDLARSGEFRIELPRDRYPDALRAREAVEARGGRVLHVHPHGEQGQSLALEAALPETERERVLSAIGDLDRRVRIRPARTIREVQLSSLHPGPDALLVREGDTTHTLALTDVISVRVLDTVHIPADAVLLLEGERPRDQIKTILILVFLSAFASVNLLALRRPH
jgi:hypothetical protein